MFTVKHRDGAGVERLYQANTVEKIRRGDQYEDGIYLDRTPESVAHIITFEPAHSTTQVIVPPQVSPIVYVMNEHGATVATYHL